MIYVNAQNRVKDDDFTIYLPHGTYHVKWTTTRQEPGWGWQVWVQKEGEEPEYQEGFASKLREAKERIDGVIREYIRRHRE